MELELRNNDDAAVIILGGRIDSTNAPEAEKEIMEAVAQDIILLVQTQTVIHLDITVWLC